jgi:hypothetical protein
MSKNNNVNPGQYKVAGRERQGENLGQTKDKQAFKASPSGKQKHGEPQPPQKKTRASGR